MGEGIEEWGSGGIGSKPLARGGESARGLDPSEDEIQAGVGLSFGVQAPSIDPNQLGEQNCGWGGTEFLPEAVKGGGRGSDPQQHPLGERLQRSTRG